MRSKVIDEVRGIAFILMVVHHLCYFKDVSNHYQTNYSGNKVIDRIGYISRVTFILLVGVSLYQGYIKTKEKESFKRFLEKRSKRSLIILIHAMILTVITYILYPQYYIRFGVLHFIALGSLVGALFVPRPNLAGISALVLSLFWNSKLAKVDLGQLPNLILGTNVQYNMMDYFPLLKWLPLVLLGIFLGSVIENPDKSLLEKIPILEKIGKNSLNLYTAHLVILLLVWKKYKN